MKTNAVFFIFIICLVTGCSSIPVTNTGTGKEYLNDQGTRKILLYPQSRTFMLRQFDSTFKKSGILKRKTHHYLIRHFYGSYSISKKTISFIISYIETFEKYRGLNPDELQDSRRAENLKENPIEISLRLRILDEKYLKLDNAPATKKLPKGFPGETGFRFISNVNSSGETVE